jgi:hypothetical protein
MRISPVLLFSIYLAACVVATLWPFNFRQHNLATPSPGGGLVVRQPGIAFTETPPSKLARLQTFTLALRLSSVSTHERACILDYGTDERHANLRLQQENGRLDVWVESAGSRPGAGLHIPHVFDRGDTLSIMVSFDGQRLHACREGSMRRTTQIAPGEHLRWDSSATLAIGSLVDGQIGWRGTIFALAVTDGVSESSDSIEGNRVLFYDFTRTFQDSVKDDGSAPQDPLLVPERYTVPSRIILATPAHYNWHTRWFVFDMVLNIAVFLPFGYLLTIILTRSLRSVSKGTIATMLAAFLFSLTVEWLQAWLPTRNSSMVDLMCNVTGAGIGAWLAWARRLQSALLKVGIGPGGQNAT